MTTPAPTIPGYALGDPSLTRSPVTLDDLARLRATLLLGDDDVAALRRSRDVLADQTEAVLDTWYGFVGQTPHLVAAFARRSDGQPDAGYLAAVRARFGQWILDTAEAAFDQRWLDWQHELGLRHHRAKKNRTDGVEAAEVVPFRDLVALTVPVVVTLRPFLAAKGHPPEQVEAMQQAWLKAVLLQVILWSQPYVRPGDF
ncbi:MAG: protoglobin domain-containing protein [Planctomycetes bacterium]|nr:protoglobin domain-containing protein [Planctomycetota bacterium]